MTIDGTLAGTTDSGQSGPGSNGNVKGYSTFCTVQVWSLNIRPSLVSELFDLRMRELLLVDYRSYRSLIYPIKWNGISSKQWLCQYYYMDAPHERGQMNREKARWEQHKNAMSCIEQIQEAAPAKRQLYGHLPTISKSSM